MTHATLDRNRAGPALLLDESELRVMCADVADGNRTILGTVPAMSGVFAFEAYFWSESRLPQQLAIGVAEPSHPLDARAGNSAQSHAYWPAEGRIRANSADVATVPVAAERTALGVRLTLGPTSAACEWLVNGSVIHSRALPTGRVWLPALSLGADRAGGVEAIANFGATRFDTLQGRGWAEGRPGVEALYLAIEGWMSDGTGAPANTPFNPYIIDPARLAIRRRVYPWWHRTGRAVAGAAATLTLDNSDGTFNALRDGDTRDTTVVLQRAMATSGRSSAAPETVFTGVIDRVSEPRHGVVELVLRDVLSRLDRPLRMRLIPPFYESGGRPVPVGLGAQRTVRPILLSEPERLWLLGDAPMTNIAEVSDMGARLDPNALPPQYTPALDGAGLTLETLPVGRLSADISSVGAQYEIPGAQDVLSGIGDFQGWAAGAVPAGWEQGGEGTVSRMVEAGKVQARLITDAPWYPHPYGSPVTPGRFGKWIKTTGAPLIGGRSYRLRMSIPYNNSSPPATIGGKLHGGIMLRTDLSNDKAGAISAHGVAIREAWRTGYTLDFQLPPGPARPLYILVTASSGATSGSSTGTAYADIRDIRIEMLGQYRDLPLDGITPGDAFTELLVQREGEDPALFARADLDALPGYVTGYRWEDAPNILDALTEIADQYGAVIYTDELGIIRTRQIGRDGAPVAAFDRGNVELGSLRVLPDTAPGLTTSYAARPNCEPFGDGDFVTDDAEVTPARRAALTAQSQILLTAQQPLAGEYDAARGAPRQHTRLDNREDLATEARRVGEHYAERRQIVTFVALYEGGELVPGLRPEQLHPGDVVTLDDPERGFHLRPMTVLGTAHYPASGKLEITAWA